MKSWYSEGVAFIGALKEEVITPKFFFVIEDKMKTILIQKKKG